LDDERNYSESQKIGKESHLMNDLYPTKVAAGREFSKLTLIQFETGRVLDTEMENAKK